MKDNRPDWPFDYGITAKFREGVKRVCVARAWSVFEGCLNAATDDQMAVDLHVYRTNLSLFRKGRMNGAQLFTLLTHLGLDCEELDPLPPVQDRAMSGYQVAIHFIRKRNTNPADSERISYEVFSAMATLVDTDAYKSGLVHGRWDWEVVAQEVTAALASKMVAAPFTGGAELANLHENWMASVCRCLDGIPYRWL